MQTVQLGVSCACVHSLLLVLVLVHTMQLGLSCACGHRAVRSLVLVRGRQKVDSLLARVTVDFSKSRQSLSIFLT